jgi:hypothetical protein
MPVKRAQSAMEYLMTYGWAILIIAVVLGVLFQLGVFSSSSFSVRVPPGACQVLRTSAAVNLVGQCSGVLPQYVSTMNGASSYVNLADLPETSSGTVALWIRPATSIGTSTPSQTMFTDGGGITLFFQFNYLASNGKASFGYFDTAWQTVETAQSTWAGNTWYYLAASWGGNGLSIYVNGALSNSNPALTGKANSVSAVWMIGRYAASYFNGQIANVQAYNTSLAADEIRNLYLEGIGGAPVKPQNLVGWWPLNGDTKDYSGNNNNGAPTAVSYLSQYGK